MHPYYKAILDANAGSGRPFYHQLSPEEARAMLAATMAAAPRPASLPELAFVQDDVIAGVAVRRYMPLGGALGAAVYLHSGGWVVGGLQSGDAVCRRLAAASQCEMISVDYRLAPEHPFPEPLEDAWAVLCAVARRGGPVMLVGESAGGNLAAACSIKARDEGFPALSGVVLAYPVTDCDFETSSYRDIGPRNWLLSTADMRWFWDHYCPAGVDRSDPLVAPLRVSEAGGLAPAFIRVAQLDPLRSEGEAYARTLEAAGVPVDFGCDEGVLHGYWGAAGVVDAATDAVASAGAWMRSRIEAGGTADAIGKG